MALGARRARQTKEMLERYNDSGEEKRREAPQPGDILLFYRPGRRFDYVIQFFTDSPFYHTALWAGDNRVIEARPKGVINDDLQGREDNFVVVPAPEGRGAEALAWAKTQLGAKFSHMDMFMNGLDHIFVHFDINYTTPDQYTCAEFVTTCFDHAGVNLFPDRDRDDISPSDLGTLLPSESRPENVVPSLHKSPT